MKSSKYLLCIFCLAMIIFEPGCVVIHGGPYVYDEIEIDIAPPPPPRVIVTPPPRPSSVHVWIEGHYIVTGGRWVWSPG
ncbi:MAG: hypothetical protein JW715_06635, partial [Sedimentisphaerales bacterium]|nr:hypothetical protein [Sedimentisphaerales bacterium]